MQFELDEDLISVRELAGTIFTDRADVDRVRQVESSSGGYDATLWGVLADAGLLGIPLPEDAGGAGMGMLGLITLLEQQGRRVAPVPLWAVLATAAMPIARFGSAEQTGRWLPGLLDGSMLITGGFDRPPGRAATVTGRRDGDDVIIRGELLSVPAGAQSAAVLLPVLLDSRETVVTVVPTDRDGVSVTDVQVTSREASAALTLDDVRLTADDLLPGDGAEIARWTRRRARVAQAAVALGACEEALAITAAYTSERVQFGRPLSTNQAVAMRAADAYLDIEGIRLTTQRAAWLMDSDREAEVEAAALTASWWAARAGLRVVHTTQHLHGGIGADVDYPIHRYFLWCRQIAFSYGTADALAAELGDELEHGPLIGAAG